MTLPASSVGRHAPGIRRRQLVGGLIATGLIGFGTGRVVAATPTHRLLMIEDAGCIYCVRWHAEVGPAYSNSAEGRYAPLERRRIRDPEIAFLRNVRYTPTFVLLRGDQEIGRIEGYSGNLFWDQLAVLMAKTPFDAAPAPPV
jgi:hypothetical protein